MMPPPSNSNTNLIEDLVASPPPLPTNYESLTAKRVDGEVQVFKNNKKIIVYRFEDRDSVTLHLQNNYIEVENFSPPFRLSNITYNQKNQSISYDLTINGDVLLTGITTIIPGNANNWKQKVADNVFGIVGIVKGIGNSVVIFEDAFPVSYSYYFPTVSDCQDAREFCIQHGGIPLVIQHIGGDCTVHCYY